MQNRNGGNLKMKRRIAALILAAIMVFALCACTGNGSGKTALEGQNPNEKLTKICGNSES